MLQETALGNHRLEFITADEVVIHAVLLAGAHGPGGVRHRHTQLRILTEHFRDKAGFARARGSGNYKQGTLLTGLAHGLLTPNTVCAAPGACEKTVNYTGFDLYTHPEPCSTDNIAC